MSRLFKYQEFVKHTLNETNQSILNEEIIDIKEWPVEKTRELFTITKDNFKDKLKSEIDKFIEINITQDKELYSSSIPSGIYSTYRESKLAEMKYFKKTFGEISNQLKKFWEDIVFIKIKEQKDKYASDLENFKNWNWGKSELKKLDIKNSYEIASKIANVAGNGVTTIIDELKKEKDKTPQDLWTNFEKYIINGRDFWYNDASKIISSTILNNPEYNKETKKLETIINNSPYVGLKEAIENRFKEYYTLYRIYMFANALATGIESVKVKSTDTTSGTSSIATTSTKRRATKPTSEPTRKLTSSERQAILSARSDL